MSLYRTQYVIHKHIKTRRDVHYDLRFKVGNKLKSIFTRTPWNKIPTHPAKLVLQAPDHDMKWLTYEGDIVSKRGKIQHLKIVSQGNLEIGITKHDNIVLHFLTDTRDDMANRIIVLVKTDTGEYLAFRSKREDLLEKVKERKATVSLIDKILQPPDNSKVYVNQPEGL